MGVLAEVIRRLPDPDLWSSAAAAPVVGVIAGGLAVALISARKRRQDAGRASEADAAKAEHRPY